MYKFLEEVRSQLQVITNRLLKHIPSLRLAFIAHGDYCDRNYVLQLFDFSADAAALSSFLEEVDKTGGGDAPEAYELVLRDALSLSWKADHKKVLVVIGDEVPHAASYTDQSIYWRDCLKKLADAGITVYGVQALNNPHATPFYSEIATASGGFHLHLEDFTLMAEMFVALCFRATSQQKFEDYQKVMKSKSNVSPQLLQILKELEKPTDQKTFNLIEPWWDRQYDDGEALFSWNLETKMWKSL